MSTTLPNLPALKIQLSPVQLTAKQQFDDPTVLELLTGGGAGSSKTFLLCLLALMRCRDYPGVVEGLGRKEMKRLKQTTVATLLGKVHPYLGVKEHEFVYKEQAGEIHYRNGSKIILIDMAYQPSDPDFDTFGSLELTDVFIEEVGEIHYKAVSVLNTRKNRMLNKEYGIVGKTVMTCNPSQNFIRQEFYEPFKRLGGGRLQRWPHGDVILPDGSRQTAYRAFVRSTVLDNPFIDRNYIEVLKAAPVQERKRLFEGNWDYADDDDSLFPSLILDKAIAYELPEPGYDATKFDRYIGVDVADKGKDKTIATLIERGVAIKQVEIDHGLGPEELATSDKPLSLLLANKLIEFAQQHGFTAAQSKYIAIEGNGVGVGMRDFLRVRGWAPSLYEATGTSRSQSYYALMQDMDAGKIRIIHGIDDGELRRQLAAHTYEMVDQQPRVIKKEKLKRELGCSPDKADSMMIAAWCVRGGFTTTDPKRNQSRIAL